MGKGAKIAIAVILVLVTAFFAVSYAFDRQALAQLYERKQPAAPRLLLSDTDIAKDYPFTNVSFELDGYTLRGHVYGADNARGLVVFRHGISSQHEDYLALIVGLVDKGWRVFAYDAIGCGESDGSSVLGFSQSPRDVHAAVQFAKDEGIAEGLPILLFGHSWGGYGVAAALAYGDGVAGCVSMSGFDTPLGVSIASTKTQMGAFAYTQVPTLAFIDWQDFGADAGRSASRAIDESGLPVLVIQGAADTVVTMDESSIMAKRDSIANPQVRYIVKDEPGRDGHSDYFYTRESWEYFGECSQAYAELAEAYDEVPQDVIDEFMASVDKRRANTADSELIEQIDSFFASCI